jgi:hypothetical protein
MVCLQIPFIFLPQPTPRYQPSLLILDLEFGYDISLLPPPYPSNNDLLIDESLPIPPQPEFNFCRPP